MQLYRITTSHSETITEGLQGHDYASRTAQAIASQRGESVYLSPIRSAEEIEEADLDADQGEEFSP